jgi:hypothetical protein
VLYVELMAAPDHEACFECDPEQFRDGWHPMMSESPLVALHHRTFGTSPVHCREECCRRREGREY